MAHHETPARCNTFSQPERTEGSKELNDTSTYTVVDSRYGKLTVLANDTGSLTRSLLTYGEWAENEISFLRQFVADGSTVLDIGAYIGTHTLAFASFAGANGTVIAFEPQPDSFELLRKNVSENHPPGGRASAVRLYNAVASSAMDKVEIDRIDVRSEASFGSTSLLPTLTNTRTAETTDGENRVRVQALTIDSLALRECALMKVDVEGMEDIVLRGARETLQRCSPVVYCECNSLSGGLKTIAVLQSAGYSVFGYVVDAFNPENFFGVQENMFGRGREVALLGLPGKRGPGDLLPARPVEAFMQIEEADDLVLALLSKPQYRAEVLRPSRAAQTGGAALLDEYDREVSDLRALLAQRDADIRTLQEGLQRLVTERDETIKHLDNEVSTLRRSLTEQNTRLRHMYAAGEMKDAEVQRLNALVSSLCASASWKVTEPLRWAARELRRFRGRP